MEHASPPESRWAFKQTSRHNRSHIRTVTNTLFEGTHLAEVDKTSTRHDMKAYPAARSASDGLDTVPDTASPAYAGRHPVTRAFDKFASAVTRWAGSPVAFSLSVFSVVAWLVTGPIFHYSQGWQLVINTGTTIVTFLMVFLIQQSQNKDSVAMHLKLNELLSSHRSADNHLIGIEDASEEELRRLATAYLRLSTKRPDEEDIQRKADETRACHPEDAKA